MLKASPQQERMHYDLTNVGLRAQATAAGLVQLCKELHALGVLNDPALKRIKSAIADEIALTAPRPVRRADYRQEICARLDALFKGDVKVGTADALAYPETEEGAPAAQ